MCLVGYNNLINLLLVPGDQHCELNCRAIGFRFYVRQSDRVIDGTPCGQNDTSLCVAGKCTVGLFLFQEENYPEKGFVFFIIMLHLNAIVCIYSENLISSVILFYLWPLHSFIQAIKCQGPFNLQSLIKQCVSHKAASSLPLSYDCPHL